MSLRPYFTCDRSNLHARSRAARRHSGADRPGRRRAGALLAGRPSLVRERLRASDTGPVGRLGGHRGRAPHAHPRADRQRQDPRRIPVVPRPARSRSRRPSRPRANPGTVRVLYVSPLKALTYDVERNLRAPLHGISLAADRLGEPVPRISIASRTGDTPQEDRRELAQRPPDILVTTPESLYLLLTSAARETLRGVETVILDEVHAIAGTKRGAHLALSLERLEHLRASDAPPLQRIGLSATQRPLETIARFLGGNGAGREVSIVDAGSRKPLELRVVVPGRGHEPARRGPPARGAARRRRRPRRHAQQHLAGDPPAAPGAHPGPSQHDRLHEQPAARGAAGAAPQRARRRGARPGPPRQHRPRAAPPDRGGPQGRPGPRHRGDVVSSSSASTWARSISSCSSSRRPASLAGSSGSGVPATASASRRRGSSSRSSGATCSRPPSSRGGCTRAPSRRP